MSTVIEAKSFSTMLSVEDNRDIYGLVLESGSTAPVYGAVVKLGQDYLWTITDDKGHFLFTDVQPGDYMLEVSCLGYVSVTMEIDTEAGDKIKDGLKVYLKEQSLAIDEVVVTAQKSKDGLNTSHRLGRDALNHLQLSNITDVTSLLPGGKTVNPDLTAENTFSIREGGSTVGNAAFGTAVEVDGVRLGNNASFGSMGGVDTRSIAVENIESIEVITGVPSAEYGDLNSGVVKINTRKGRTPVNVTFSVNPRTYQVSASKGIDLQKDNGVLNVSAEWARAVAKLVSPYTSYSRGGITFGYSNTFRKVLRFEAGFTGNIGGMNSKDDPDVFTGEYEKARDNVFRANTSLTWLLNKTWVTNLKFTASVNFHDEMSHYHYPKDYAAVLPAVHSEKEGYFIADKLPLKFFAEEINDSKELDMSAALKYDWQRRWGDIRNSLKAGLQWKANGNVGQGEYYADSSLSPDGYRPRPYTDYPFMHNVALWVEDHFTLPVARTRLEVTAGLRMENVIISGTQYRNINTFSPRFNAKWTLSDNFSVRGGWGITEKLPSFYILYPKQEYRDIRTFDFSHGNSTTYVYYTQPYQMQYNPDLKWQRSSNAEIGAEMQFGEFRFSLVGFYNRTHNPYKYSSCYTPFAYNMMKLPDGYTIPSDPFVRVDSETGHVYVRAAENDYWVPMDVKVTDRTFSKTTMQDNGADIHRAGVEIVAEFPEIKPIRTSFRLDMSYATSNYVDDNLSYYYQNGWSHTSLQDRSYQYVGIYANGGGTSVANGKITHNWDANLTAITHIPQARIIITCRLEMSLLKRSRNLSRYNGADYAYTVTQESNSPTGGNIMDGNSYTAIRPVAYMDLDGNVFPFTEAEAANPDFYNLILKSSNAYTFAQDGYDPYFSANLSITKEIGKNISLSFFANNFTNSRRAVTSYATGVSVIFTPAFYYGLTCRLKF
ncbi:MAG: TonB-dependent receptor [Bacteroidales bacterium]|nr:TonB-dependent receptor [Bacteroidales bacterium]